VNAEFDWWLLIVGVVVGAVLTYLVLADSARRDHDVLEIELPAEATWIARTVSDEGTPLDPIAAEAALRAHRRYLALPPPDALVDPATLRPVDQAHIAPAPANEAAVASTARIEAPDAPLTPLAPDGEVRPGPEGAR
jgi:hypothetical protein